MSPNRRAPYPITQLPPTSGKKSIEPHSRQSFFSGLCSFRQRRSKPNPRIVEPTKALTQSRRTKFVTQLRLTKALTRLRPSGNPQHARGPIRRYSSHRFRWTQRGPGEGGPTLIVQSLAMMVFQYGDGYAPSGLSSL